MPIPNQKLREITFLLLYSHDVQQKEAQENIDLLMHELKVTRKVVALAQERVAQILSLIPELDLSITKTTRSYDFQRIQVIERNVLRLGLFELLYDNQIPPKVAIAEALRLTRKFGTLASVSFVNAILDNLYKLSLGEKIDDAEITKSVQSLIREEKISERAAIENDIRD